MRTRAYRSAAPLILVATLAAAGSTAAQGRIEVSRGVDRMVFGSCVPSLKAVNNTRQMIDYIEVGLRFRLSSGATRMLSFRSRYRDGVERPIAPGVTADLTVQLDLSQPLGAACPDILHVELVEAVCEAGGTSCAGLLAVDPLPR